MSDRVSVDLKSIMKDIKPRGYAGQIPDMPKRDYGFSLPRNYPVFSNETGNYGGGYSGLAGYQITDKRGYGQKARYCCN